MTGFNGNRNNWTDNSDSLNNGAWAHSGGSPWFEFRIDSTVEHLTITVTNAQANSWTPGFTLYTSGSNPYDGGTGDKNDVGQAGFNSPHSFNQVGQIGDAGTLWMTGTSGNMLATLAYANSGVAHTDASENDWGQVIQTGVNAVSSAGLYFDEVHGEVGAGFAKMELHGLTAGYYTLFVGGACTACGNSTFNLSAVSTLAPVPEPETYAMLLAGLGLVGVAVRRRTRG